MALHGSPVAIDADQATTIFAGFASTDELALRFPADGCYARAHLMVKVMLDQGLVPTKAWAFAASTTDLLWVETPDHVDGRVQWGYHVAPVLLVRGPDGQARELVFDPLLFDHPVTIDEWRTALHDTPSLLRTPPGEPPLPARGGTGYWPGPDPLEGTDVHARETLEEYRRGNG